MHGYGRPSRISLNTVAKELDSTAIVDCSGRRGGAAADWLGVQHREALLNVDGAGADGARELVPYPVWAGGCGCGCPQFNVRDRRFPPRAHELEHFSTGHARDRSVGVRPVSRADSRPLSVNVETWAGVYVDHQALIVTWA